MCLFSCHTKKLVPVFVCAMFVLCIVHVDMQRTNHRVKRKVMFTKSSKFFFRLNGKANSINYTEIFAIGYAMRINYDLPSTIPKRYKFFKRDIHDDLGNMEEPVLRGFSCVLKHFCQLFISAILTEKCGFFCEIGKFLTREDGTEGNFFKTFLNKCKFYDSYNNVCPHTPGEISIFSYG